MIAIGIDQSYTRIGIAVVKGVSVRKAKILSVKSFGYKGLKSKREKRAFVAKLVRHAIERYVPDDVLCERIRMFSKGFVSTGYIKATGALIATIVDNSYPNKVYSCDTRAWKAQVIGPQKKGAGKVVSVNYVQQRFGLELDDDAADAVCIALYALSPKRKLKEEL